MKVKTISLMLVLVVIVSIFAGCAEEKTANYVEYFAPGEYLVTNVADSYRLLKAAPVLEVNQEGLTDQLKLEQHVIRDVIIGVIRVKTEEQLRAGGIMDELRVEVKQALVDQLGMTYVTAVYFSDFVVQ